MLRGRCRCCGGFKDKTKGIFYMFEAVKELIEYVDDLNSEGWIHHKNILTLLHKAEQEIIDAKKIINNIYKQ